MRWRAYQQAQQEVFVVCAVGTGSVALDGSNILPEERQHEILVRKSALIIVLEPAVFYAHDSA